MKKGILVSGILGATLLLTPLSVRAFCLSDCQTKAAFKPNSILVSQQKTDTSHSFNRDRSHNYRDMKNSVSGDVNIWLGHEKVEIQGVSNSPNSYINNSISSVVNLGDVVAK